MDVFEQKENMLVKYQGKLRYGNRHVVVDLDKEFGDYYYSLIPKYREVQKQKYPSHITVVRSFEIPDRKNWGFWDGKIIRFKYDNTIQFNGLYYYLDVWGGVIGFVRKVLGLKRYRSGKDRYHITIGNVKNKKKEF